MFVNEAELQQLVHEQPELILSGIPEINPEYCSDTPKIISLGREIPLRSGPIDNLYLDTNGIITLVECKTYSNSGIKRSVYSQAINYASDLQNMLIHYSGSEFIEQFYSIITEGISVAYPQFDSIVAQLSQDRILEGKNKHDWKQQFLQRLEFNIKNGVFRIVILCAPSHANSFACAAVRNLMQLMTFSESGNSKYDLILMDLRGKSGTYQTQMIWRRYCPLPQIPLLAKSTKEIRVIKEKLPLEAQATLQQLLDGLPAAGIDALENTLSYSLYDTSTKRSINISIGIEIEQGTWFIKRRQIRKSELLFKYIEGKDLSARLTDDFCDELIKMKCRYQLMESTTKVPGLEGTVYEIRVYPLNTVDVRSLINLLKNRLRYQPLELDTFTPSRGKVH